MTSGHELVRFRIPASFVADRLLLTRAELAYGYRQGWLSREDVVALALAKYRSNVPLSGPEDELALLLSDDLDRVDELVSNLEITDEPAEERARPWLFLAIAWLLEHAESYDLPGFVEMLYADFDYPDEIEHLVSFSPAKPADRLSSGSIERRCRAYVERIGSEYRKRDAPGAGEQLVDEIERLWVASPLSHPADSDG